MRPQSPQVSVGIDLVRVSRVAESLHRFGERFLRRVFTDGEIAYANTSPELASERLAARFAAKEATIKALDLVELGVGWRSIEVERGPRGKCRLVLHGPARAAADAAGVAELSVSLSHEGDYATAVVLAIRQEGLPS
jgi:holo-[acyl-carrier protein] synthase